MPKSLLNSKNTIHGIGTEVVSKSLLGSFSTTHSQSPSGLGDAGKIIVNFGVGGATSDGSVVVGSDGIISCTEDKEIILDLIFRLARTGGAGVSILLGRMMYADDGVTYSQYGSTFVVKVDDADTIWREFISIPLKVSKGSKYRFEVARDPAGHDSGSLSTEQPSGSLSTWSPSNSVEMNIYEIVST